MTMARSASDRAPTSVRVGRHTKAGVVATILIVVAASAAEVIDHGFDLKIQELDPGSYGGPSATLVDVGLIERQRQSSTSKHSDQRPDPQTVTIIASLTHDPMISSEPAARSRA